MRKREEPDATKAMGLAMASVAFSVVGCYFAYVGTQTKTMTFEETLHELQLSTDGKPDMALIEQMRRKVSGGIGMLKLKVQEGSDAARKALNSIQDDLGR